MNCRHEWKTYTGLTEVFDYCNGCGVKKSDAKDEPIETSIYDTIMEGWRDRYMRGAVTVGALISLRDWASLIDDERLRYLATPFSGLTQKLTLNSPFGSIEIEPNIYVYNGGVVWV